MWVSLDIYFSGNLYFTIVRATKAILTTCIFGVLMKRSTIPKMSAAYLINSFKIPIEGTTDRTSHWWLVEQDFSSSSFDFELETPEEGQQVSYPLWRSVVVRTPQWRTSGLWTSTEHNIGRWLARIDAFLWFWTPRFCIDYEYLRATVTTAMEAETNWVSFQLEKNRWMKPKKGQTTEDDYRGIRPTSIPAQNNTAQVKKRYTFNRFKFVAGSRRSSS